MTGARRIGRHLWRMCLGFTFSVGSAFTTGLPRLLPKTGGRSRNPPIYPSIVLTGVDDPLDDPGAVHALVQRLGADLNQASRFAASASGKGRGISFTHLAEESEAHWGVLCAVTCHAKEPLSTACSAIPTGWSAIRNPSADKFRVARHSAGISDYR